MSLPLWLKRDYRAVSFALCSAVIGVILMRVIVYFVPINTSVYSGSILSSTIFTLPVQLVFFFGIPFCIYKFYGKRTVKQTLKYSSANNFRIYMLIAIPLGICAFVVTIAVSTMWSALLEATGYKYISADPPMPAKFNFGYFAAEICLTAILPAVCEEFIMRGGFLTTARTRYGTVGCVVLCGIAFGLFHQNIRQVFYTALMGALLAYLTIKHKSIFPAVLVHFTNNFCSVYISYASKYKWAIGGRFYQTINLLANGRAWALVLIYLAVMLAGVGLVLVMQFVKDRRVYDKKSEVIRDSAFDVTNKRVVLFGQYDPDKIEQLEMEKEVYGSDYKPEKMRPSLRDIMIIIALGVVSVCTTVFTYVWGFFY